MEEEGVKQLRVEGSRCGGDFVVVIVVAGVVVACVVVVSLKGRFVAVLSWLLSL